MEFAWSVSDTTKTNIDTEKGWHKVRSKVGIKANNSSSGKGKNSRFLYQMMAAACIVIVMGVSLIVTLKNRTDWTVLQTAANSEMLIQTLPDGSVVYLSENSTLRYSQKFGNKSRDVELSGEAFFDIQPNKTKPFIIETQSAKIEVLGTSFRVKSEEQGSFELSVTTGLVNVTSKVANQSVLATIGEKVCLVENSLIKSIETNTISSPLMNKRIMFKDETLENIASLLDKNFGTKIIFEPLDLGKSRITVTFKTHSAETILGVICETMQLNSRRMDDKIILTKKTHANP
jgi:ferric-dicitrate binding protein FerR (iron transport regulator)